MTEAQNYAIIIDMAKQSEQADATSPERKQKLGFGQVIGSKWHYLVVLVFGLILSAGIWAIPQQVLRGDDFAFHVARLQSALRGWNSGQIIPQVDPEVLSGFGYAYNLFYGPVLTYIAAGLQIVIGSWPVVCNLVVILCLVGAGLMMCYAMTKISKNRMLAMLIAVIYMASPYLLNNIYSRMALGEVAAAVVVPILLLGLYQLTAQEKHAARNIALALALLIWTHSLSALIFGMMGVVYVILNIDKILNWKSIWRIILGLVVGLGLAAGFILPLVEARLEGDYGVFDTSYSAAYFGVNASDMNDHRVWPQQLVLMDFTQSDYGVSLGVMALTGLIGFWFIRRTIESKPERRFVTTLYIISALAILMTLAIVDWKYMPSLLWHLQFPWRFLMVAMTALSVVAGYTIFTLVRRMSREKQAVWAIIMSVMAVYVVMPKIIPDAEKHLADFGQLENNATMVGFQAEYAPRALLCSPEAQEDLEQGYTCSLSKLQNELEERGAKIKLLIGAAELSHARRESGELKFQVKNTSGADVKVELPLIYYPGYQAVTGQGEELAVESSELGLVTVTLPVGMSGVVSVHYGVSKATEIGMVITAGTAALGIIWVMISGVLDWRKRRKKQEVDSLIDSVWEAMAEHEELESALADEGVEDLAEKKKPRARSKSTRAKATKEKAAKDEELMDSADGKKAASTGTAGRKTRKKTLKSEDVAAEDLVMEDEDVKKPAKTPKTASTTKRRSTKAAAKTNTMAAAELSAAEEKASKAKTEPRKTRTKTTVKTRRVEPKERVDEEREEDVPRVTKVKVRAKKKEV